MYEYLTRLHSQTVGTGNETHAVGEFSASTLRKSQRFHSEDLLILLKLLTNYTSSTFTKKNIYI